MGRVAWELQLHTAVHLFPTLCNFEGYCILAHRELPHFSAILASVLAYDFFREFFIDNYCCCFHCNYARYHYLSLQIHSTTYLLLWKQSVDDISRASAPSDFLLGSPVGSLCRLAGKNTEGLGFYSPVLRANPCSCDLRPKVTATLKLPTLSNILYL